MECSRNEKKYEYKQKSPEDNLLYQTIRGHYQSFKRLCEQDGKGLPSYVKEEFEAFLRCGQIYYGFTRRQCESCGHEHLLPFSCKKRGFCPSCCARRAAENQIHLIDHILPHEKFRQWCVTLPIGVRYLVANNSELQSAIHSIIIDAIDTHIKNIAELLGVKKPFPGSITFIQRQGTALNLNPHFHIIYLDGVYHFNSKGDIRFQIIPRPNGEDLTNVIQDIRNKVVGFLQKTGILSDELEIIELPEDKLAEIAPSLAQSQKASVTQFIALGERAGLPVRKIGYSMGYMEEEAKITSKRCVALNGFTLHANTAISAYDRKGLENLVSYVARPPVSSKRLSLRDDGLLQYDFKRPYSDGTSAIVLSPLEFLEKIASLVPPPKMHQIRYNGVFAPASPIRSKIILNPEKKNPEPCDEGKDPNSYISWSKLMSRIFNLDMDKCPKCGGRMKVIAQIQDRNSIDRFLKHIGKSTDPPDTVTLQNKTEYIFD